MSGMQLDLLLGHFRDLLIDCRRLYVSSADLVIQRHPEMIKGSPREFRQLLDDLHRGLLIKIFVTIAQADRHWSPEERRMAEYLFYHLWGENLNSDQLKQAAAHVAEQAATLKWYALIRPFDQIAPLRERGGELETIAMRLANVVAKIDGTPTPEEVEAVRSVQDEITTLLHPISLDGMHDHEKEFAAGAQAVQQIKVDASELPLEKQGHATSNEQRQPEASDKSPEERLSQSLETLDQMIGMANIKQEMRTLINFLKIQKQREEAGLPKTNLSQHLVFGGNPGTGKTTVARIVGEVYGAMGFLSKGHLVETDRAGLVAEYAGQTAPKANKKIDEALDGVLFIDEAYSLVANDGEDIFGREAIQAILKRMEDNRDRLVIILAGYPKPMKDLLKTNPGLSSRFTHNLKFEDYTPGQLGRIFGQMCDTNQYVVPAEAQAKLLMGFNWLYNHRDEHFGNGRSVRNIFERAIRNLANRISSITPLTKELLTQFEPEDFEIANIPNKAWREFDEENQRFTVDCPSCENSSRIPAGFLGKRVKCKRCDHRFTANWGEPSET